MKVYVTYAGLDGEDLVEALREDGHDVHARTFFWDTLKKALVLGGQVDIADQEKDLAAMANCDACVLTVPRQQKAESSHFEAGYVAGRGRPVILLIEGPECLMPIHRLASAVCESIYEVCEALKKIDTQATKELVVTE